MASIAERAASMTISVVSPDNQIRGVLKGGFTNPQLQFRPGCYPYYDERTLEHQLASLAKLMYTGYQRGYNQIIDEAGGTRTVDPRMAGSIADIGYLTELRQLTVQGASRDNIVRVRSLALMDWKVRIADGTVQAVEEERFLQYALEAARTVVQEFQYERIALVDEYYGLGNPEFTAYRKKRQAAEQAN